MAWKFHKDNIMAISAVTAFFLFGGGTLLGLDLHMKVLGPFQVIHILAAGAAYTFFALWKRYL